VVKLGTSKLREALAQVVVVLQIEEADVDATIKAGWVLDNFPNNFSQLASLQKAHAGVLPDLFVCLIDATDRGRRETQDSNQTHKHACTLGRVRDTHHHLVPCSASREHSVEEDV
jgi:hypothetical protein